MEVEARWWVLPTILGTFFVVLPPAWWIANRTCLRRLGSPRLRRVLRTMTLVGGLSVWQASLPTEMHWERVIYAVAYVAACLFGVEAQRITLYLVLCTLSTTVVASLVATFPLAMLQLSQSAGPPLFCLVQTLCSMCFVAAVDLAPQYWRSGVVISHLYELLLVFVTVGQEGTRTPDSWWREPLLSVAACGVGAIMLYVSAVFVGPHWSARPASADASEVVNSTSKPRDEDDDRTPPQPVCARKPMRSQHRVDMRRPTTP